MTLGLAAMACFYGLTGTAHFIWPQTYHKMIPPRLPNPKLINVLAGLAELGLAIGLCFKSSQILAAWGLIGLLLAVLPVNWRMISHPLFGGPRWLYIARIPLQAIFIYWSWTYTRLP